MQGAGNDFIVLDATRSNIDFTPAQWRTLADRRFGVGADQILVVGPARDCANDFSYRIINHDGSEVEHCGNGARAFLHYVQTHGLTDRDSVRVEIKLGVIVLRRRSDGLIAVEMGIPRFAPADVAFNATGLTPTHEHMADLWALPLDGQNVVLETVSMGNPHAVQVVADVDTAPVTTQGPVIECHPRFTQRVNVGFMQVLDPHAIRLRVWERGAGETLACGTGACAAVVSGIARGLLQSPVRVQARGGELEVAWAGPGTTAVLSGPAAIVFEGEIDV